MENKENLNPAEEMPLRKKKIALGILVTALSLVLVLLVAGVGTLSYVLGQIGSGLDETYETIPPHLEDFETDPPETTEEPTTDATTQPTTDATTQPTTEATTQPPTETTAPPPPPTTTAPPNVDWPTVEQLHSPDVVNILLIGQDTRVPGQRSRSDTMILLSINKKNNTISMVSFMRDLYVQIPGYSDNRLNAPYRFKGADLLNQTMNLNFGITVDGNVAVNFNQFISIINTLGGVDINLTAKEADHLRGQGYNVVEGKNHLNGSAALAYCRIRKIDSDHKRTERQRNVLDAIAQSARNASITELMAVVNQVLPYVETNLSDSQLVSYTTSALSILSSGGTVKSGKVPQSGMYHGASIRGMSVMMPDLNACNAYLKSFIYG